MSQSAHLPPRLPQPCVGGAQPSPASHAPTARLAAGARPGALSAAPGNQLRGIQLRGIQIADGRSEMHEL
jgi:hypothetical protein